MSPKGSRRNFLKGIGAAAMVSTAGCIGGIFGAGELTWSSGLPTREQGSDPQYYYPYVKKTRLLVERESGLTIENKGNKKNDGYPASIANIKAMKDGDADLGMVQSDAAGFATEGTTLEAFDGSGVKKLRGVATLWPVALHLVTTGGNGGGNSSGVKSVSDLTGKTVSTGVKGSSHQVNATQLLETIGVTDFTEKNMIRKKSIQALKNGDIDAFFLMGGLPTDRLSGLAREAKLSPTGSFTIVGMNEETRKKATENLPWAIPATIKRFIYPTISEDVQTIAAKVMIASHTDANADRIKLLLETHYGNLGSHGFKANRVKQIKKKKAKEGMTVPLHEGAKKYFG